MQLIQGGGGRPNEPKDRFSLYATTFEGTPSGSFPDGAASMYEACRDRAMGEMFPGSCSNARHFVASCGAAEESVRKRREEPGQRKRPTPDDQTGDTKATKRTVAFSCPQSDPVRPRLKHIPQSKGHVPNPIWFGPVLRHLFVFPFPNSKSLIVPGDHQHVTDHATNPGRRGSAERD